jgi:hypothetical protein
LADTLGGFEKRLDALARGLSGVQMKRLMAEVGRGAVRDARSALPPDLGGDHKFSGWAADLDVKFTPHRNASSVTVHPTRRGAGPWRVAEQGRNQGNASGFAGPGINRQTGETARTKSGGIRKQRARKARRWNGRTAGKNTWSDAERLMADRTPPRVARGLARLIRDTRRL